jgi:hypothetical protein
MCFLLKPQKLRKGAFTALLPNGSNRVEPQKTAHCMIFKIAQESRKNRANKNRPFGRFKL